MSFSTRLQWMVVVVLSVGAMGCGGGSGGRNDAGGDGNVPDDSVQLTVYDRTTGALDANESVLFFGPNGQFITEVATGDDGVASADLPNGGSVVFMFRSDSDALPYAPVAYLGVQPGDRLRFGGPLPARGSVTITVPEVPNTMTYRTSLACGEHRDLLQSATASFTTESFHCSDAMVVVAATDTGTILGTLAANGVDSTASITLTGPYPSPAAFEMEVEGVSADAEMVALEAHHAAGLARNYANISGEGVPSAGRFQVSGMVADVDGTEIAVRVTPARAGYLSPVAWLRRPYAADISVDMSSINMPWITAPTFDIATRSVTWTEDGDGTIDAVVASPNFRRDGVEFFWVLGSGHDGDSLTLPLLPAPWTEYNPTTGDEVAGTYYFARGSDLAAQAVNDPWSFFLSSETLEDHNLAFSRTFLP